MSSLSTITPWQEEVQRHFPKMSPAQARGLAHISYAMLMTSHCGTTHISHWLAKYEGCSPKTVRQRVREWYYEAEAKRGKKRKEIRVEEHVADLLAWVLEDWEGEKRLVMVLDATSNAQRFTCLSVGVVLEGCLIPVAWTLMPAGEKGEWKSHWLRLLALLRGSIPADWHVVVMTDRGLYASWLYQAIQDNGWHPMMRVSETMGFRAEGEERFGPIGERLKRRGRTWQGQGTWSERGERLDGTLLLSWQPGYADKLAVVTDERGAEAEVAFYQMRFWTEDGFKDQKRGGWRWEQTKMTDPQRASRLWLALAVTMLWAVRVGSSEEGREQAQERHKRRTQPGKRGRPRKVFQRPRAREQSVIVRGQQTIEVAAHLGQALPLGHIIAQPWPRDLYAVGKPAACWREKRKRHERRRRQRKQGKRAEVRALRREQRERKAAEQQAEREAKRQARLQRQSERQQEQEAKRQTRREQQQEREAHQQVRSQRPTRQASTFARSDSDGPLVQLHVGRLVPVPPDTETTRRVPGPSPRPPGPLAVMARRHSSRSLVQLHRGHLILTSSPTIQENPP
jgi:hypothetical protein